LVERFWRNARPTLDRFAVEMLTALVESVSVWESIPVFVMFAVTPLALTVLDRKPFETR
jgi:DMSO/TMAO reductase YedYZ heme-binding membrane subunit